MVRREPAAQLGAGARPVGLNVRGGCYRLRTVPLPDFIRYFAETADTPLGNIALDYLKSLLRIAPVRVIATGGNWDGRWAHYRELCLTPMVGTYVNAVCVHPSRWRYRQDVATQGQMFGPEAAAEESVPARETISGTVELYTSGRRNVLFAGKMPLVQAELDAALKYEVIVCRSLEDAGVFLKRGQLNTWVAPPGDHANVRTAIVGSSEVQSASQ